MKLIFFFKIIIFLHFLFGIKLSKEIKKKIVSDISFDEIPKYLSKKILFLKLCFSQ